MLKCSQATQTCSVAQIIVVYCGCGWLHSFAMQYEATLMWYIAPVVCTKEHYMSCIIYSSESHDLTVVQTLIEQLVSCELKIHFSSPSKVK